MVPLSLPGYIQGFAGRTDRPGAHGEGPGVPAPEVHDAPGIPLNVPARSEGRLVLLELPLDGQPKPMRLQPAEVPSVAVSLLIFGVVVWVLRLRLHPAANQAAMEPVLMRVPRADEDASAPLSDEAFAAASAAHEEMLSRRRVPCALSRRVPDAQRAT